MAIKIKKKVDRPESNEPAEETPAAAAGIDMGSLSDDDLFGASASLFDWITDNKGGILTVVGIAVVGLIGYGQFKKSSHGKAKLNAQQVMAVYHIDVENVGTPEGYDSLTERAEAVIAAADAVTADVVTDEAGLMAGSSSLLLGEADAARGRYEAFVSANANTPEAVIGTMGVAASQASAGQLEPAIAALDAVEGDYEYMAPQVALFRARLVDTYGEPEAALEAYQLALNAYPDANLAGAEQRISQLEVVLGTPAAPALEEEATEEAAE